MDPIDVTTKARNTIFYLTNRWSPTQVTPRLSRGTGIMFPLWRVAGDLRPLLRPAKYSNPLQRHGTLLLQRLVQLSFAPPSYHHWMHATRTSINGYFTPPGAFESFRTFPLPNGYFLLSSIKMSPILSLYKYFPSLHTIHQKPSHLSLSVSLFLPLMLVRNGSRNEAVLEGASASPSTRIGRSNSQRAGSSGTSTDRGERIDCSSPGSLRAGSYHHGFSIRCLCSLSAIISWPIIPVILLRLYYGWGCVWVCALLCVWIIWSSDVIWFSADDLNLKINSHIGRWAAVERLIRLSYWA